MSDLDIILRQQHEMRRLRSGHFAAFPEEIVRYILQYCCDGYDLMALEKVCMRFWDMISQDTSLWGKALNLSGCRNHNSYKKAKKKGSGWTQGTNRQVTRHFLTHVVTANSELSEDQLAKKWLANVRRVALRIQSDNYYDIIYKDRAVEAEMKCRHTEFRAIQKKRPGGDIVEYGCGNCTMGGQFRLADEIAYFR
eukprot:PhF_6_TR35103/c0_g2_i2/m.51162